MTTGAEETSKKPRGVREQAVYHVRRAEKTPRKFSLKLKSSNPAMKTLNHRSSVASRSFGLAFSLLLVGGLVSSAYAGPGLSYWQGKVPAKVEQPALASKPDAVLQTGCANPQAVVVTTVEKSWPNHRGPDRVVEAVVKPVCHSCGGTTTEVSHAWPNYRGPLTTTEVAAAHACNSCMTASHS